MKLLKLATLVFITCIITTGCSTSSDSPENLLNENIIYNESRNELYNFVNQSLDGTVLLLPGNSSEMGEINELDSNIIAFQRKQDVNTSISKVGFILISKDGNEYSLKDSYLQEGEDIEYANFYDLNNDGNDEIILLINNDSITTMNIYSIVNDKIELLSNVKPNWLDKNGKYNSTKIDIGFIDDDSQLDILMMNYDYNSGSMYATLLNYTQDNKLKNSNSIEFKNVRNLKELYTSIGMVSNNRKGVVLSIPTIKDSGYITQILCLENNKLTKVFDENNEIYNSYYVPVEDINSDHIIDIPVLNNNMIENYTTNSKASALINWKIWNDKFDNDADTIFISQVYYNYKNNFKFLVPNNLANKLYIQKNIVGNSPHYIFYSYDENDKEPTELFQISIFQKNVVDETKSSTSVETILGETDNNYYQVIVNDKEAFEKYDLTLDKVNEYFSIIYE